MLQKQIHLRHNYYARVHYVTAYNTLRKMVLFYRQCSAHAQFGSRLLGTTETLRSDNGKVHENVAEK